MKFLFLFLVLTSSAVADDIRNYNLGITVRAGTVDDIKGLVVTDVTPGLRGDNSGLSVGDVLIGYRTSDTQNPEANPFRAADAGTFPQFPPTYGQMDLRYQLLAHRPSLDRTSIINLYIGGMKNAWPAGSLGVAVTQPENDPRLIVVATYPYMLAHRLGIQTGDVLAHGLITQSNGVAVSVPISGADGLDRCLSAARSAPDSAELVLRVLRPGTGDLEFTIPVTRLK